MAIGSEGVEVKHFTFWCMNIVFKVYNIYYQICNLVRTFASSHGFIMQLVLPKTQILALQRRASHTTTLPIAQTHT